MTGAFIQEIKGFLFGRLFLAIFIEISSIDSGFGIFQGPLFLEFNSKIKLKRSADLTSEKYYKFGDL